MPVTVQELIEVSYLRLRLVAGSSGIDLGIRWAHASELPDPSGWLEPGTLLMTTGLGLPNEPGAQGTYVERLARAGASGLLIGEQADEQVHAPELTNQLVTVADEYSFPVLRMPYELPFSDVARVVMEASSGQEHARIGQALRIYDTVRLVIGATSGWELIVRLGAVTNCELHVIHPVTGDPVFPEASNLLQLTAPTFDQITEKLSDRTSAGPGIVRVPYGLRPVVALAVPASRPAVLVAVSKTDDPPDLFILRHVAAVAAMEIEKLKAERESRRRSGAELLTALIDDRYSGDVAEKLLADRGLSEVPWVVAAFASTEEGGHSDLHLQLEERGVPHLLNRRDDTFIALLTHVDKAIQTLVQEIDSSVGLSNPVSKLARLADAQREAVWALRETRTTSAKIVRYGEHKTSPFLPRDLGESRAVVHHILGPLLEYDTEHDAPLLASLRTYLGCNRSLKQTSEVLHVHKQTIIYRMRRVEELTGRQLTQMEDIVDFWLALRALDLSGRDEPGHV